MTRVITGVQLSRDSLAALLPDALVGHSEQPPFNDIIVTTIILLVECHGLAYLCHHHCIVIIIAIIMDFANDHPHL